MSGSKHIQSVRDHFGQKLAALRSRVTDIENDHESLEERVAELEEENERLRALINDHDSKESRIEAIVNYAAGRRTSDQPAVKVTPQEVMGAADFCQRYAYTLVEQLPKEYGWAHDPATVDRYGATELETAAQQKAVVIDFEGVQGPAVPLSKLNNETRSKGGQT